MKKFLLRVLGAPSEAEIHSYVTIAENERDKRRSAEVEISRLKAEVLGQEARLNRVMKVIAADIGDVEPTDQKARKDYVAQAANFYESVLESKLLQMIAQTRELEDTIFLDVPNGMDRSQYDFFLKGTSNAYKMLMDWGTLMKGEHSSSLTGDTNNE